MRLSKKLHIYFGLLTACALLALLEPEVCRKFASIAVLFFVLAGWVKGARFAGTLEKGIELLPKQEQSRALFLGSGELIFRVMAEKEAELSKELEKRYSVKVEDKQSKINSLQSQINPHFLYNTLECIRSEAICQGCKSIANMAKSLASFFRYSISRRGNIVTVQDELNNIENYIMIQNYRFEDKFRFGVDIEEDDRNALSCLIPKMTIQPIVENSIFHGLETKMGECRLDIRIRMTQEKVILTISDNGVGMNEAQLEKLRYGLEHGNSAPVKEQSSSHGNGIALYNINQRLRLTFGEEYGLHVYSIEGEGTDMEILLPIKTEKEQK